MADLTKSSLPEQARHLRRPFAPEAVKWRADQKTPDAQKNVRCLVFLDSSLARERIREVDPVWSATYEFVAATAGDPLGGNQNLPVLCHLTINGHTLTDVGQIASGKPDNKHVKSAISDALKRAAVQHGVGEYLRAMPVFKVGDGGYWLNRKGEVGGLSPRGVKQLREQYAKVVDHALFKKRFGDPTDYGDIVDDERSVEPQPDVDAMFDAAHEKTTGKKPAASLEKVLAR